MLAYLSNYIIIVYINMGLKYYLVIYQLIDNNYIYFFLEK